MTLPPRFGLFNTQERVVTSKLTGQDYQVGVWLPFSYGTTGKTYPTLYMTDGDFTFGMACGLIPTLIGSGEVPEMLVVGVAYHGIRTWGEQGALRNRDFLPAEFQESPTQTRQEQFASFFQRELFPLIEREYPADPNDRAIFGFSSGGFFALHCLFTRPNMFRRILAASCTWPEADELLLEREAAYAREHATASLSRGTRDAAKQPPTDLYLAIGELDEEQLPGFTRLVERLQGRNYPNLRLFTQIFTGEGHSSGVLAKTFLEGLRTVYLP